MIRRGDVRLTVKLVRWVLDSRQDFHIVFNSSEEKLSIGLLTVMVQCTSKINSLSFSSV